MSKYGKYHLEGSQDQRICERPSKREKKAFKYYKRKKKIDGLDTFWEEKVLLKNLKKDECKEREG